MVLMLGALAGFSLLFASKALAIQQAPYPNCANIVGFGSGGNLSTFDLYQPSMSGGWNLMPIDVGTCGIDALSCGDPTLQGLPSAYTPGYGTINYYDCGIVQGEGTDINTHAACTVPLGSGAENLVNSNIPGDMCCTGITCGNSGGGTSIPGGPKDFAMGISNPGPVVQGDSRQYTVTISSKNGMTGDVDLSESYAVPGTVSFSPSTVDVKASDPNPTSIMTVYTYPTSPVGPYALQVNGVWSVQDHSVDGNLNIVAGVTVTCNPSSVAVNTSVTCTATGGTNHFSSNSWSSSPDAMTNPVLSKTVTNNDTITGEYSNAVQETVTAKDADYFGNQLGFGHTGSAIVNVGQSCTMLSYNSSDSGFSTNPSGATGNTLTVTPGEAFYTYVDYGQANIDDINPPSSGSYDCSGAGVAWQGTVARFSCTAPTTPNDYTYSTGINNADATYCATASSQTIGTITVAAPASHLECENNACTSVSGAGPNRCSALGANADCGGGPPGNGGIHGVCDPVQHACVNAAGATPATSCSSDPQCGGSGGTTHLICENNACVIADTSILGSPCSAVGVSCAPAPGAIILQVTPSTTVPIGTGVTVAIISGGDGTYTWQPGQMSVSGGGGTDTSNASVSGSYSKAGTYTVTVIDYDDPTNTASAQITVVQPKGGETTP